MPEEDLKAHLLRARMTPGSPLAGQGWGLTLKLSDGTKTGIRHPRLLEDWGHQWMLLVWWRSCSPEQRRPDSFSLLPGLAVCDSVASLGIKYRSKPAEQDSAPVLLPEPGTWTGSGWVELTFFIVVYMVLHF